MKTFFLLILSGLLFGYNVFSQESENPRKYGLSASIQSEQMDISIPIWVGERATIAPAVSILHVEDGGTDIGTGIVPKFYARMNKIAPFFALRAATFFFMPDRGDNTLDWMAGGGFGADYFFDERFSIGIEAQLNLTFSDKKSDRFGNPGGMNLNTATAITASIYF